MPHLRSSLLYPFLFPLLACGAADPGSVDSDAGSAAADGDVVSDEWHHPLTRPPTALASDANTVYIGTTNGVLLAVDQDSREETVLLDLSGGDKVPTIDAVYVGDEVLAVVSDFTDIEAFPEVEVERKLWAVTRAGVATELDSSSDSRAYLGAFVHTDKIYYSSFTSLLSIPIAGGSPTFVGESPGSTQYWILSPHLVGDYIYWAADNQVYRMELGDSDKEGEPIVQFPTFDFNGLGLLRDGDDFVVTIRGQSTTSVATFDTETLSASEPLEVGTLNTGIAATRDNYWLLTVDGLERRARSGDASELVMEDDLYPLAASDSRAFVGAIDGVYRFRD